jgi:thiamine kinase-like enzyme
MKFNQEMNEAESRLNDIKMRLKSSKKSSELKEEQVKLKAYIKKLKDEYKSSIQTNKKCMKEVDKKQKTCAQLEKNQPTQKETLIHDCKIDLAS